LGQQREFTRRKRGMTVFILKVNFLTCFVMYYVKQMRVNVVNSVTTFSFTHPFPLVVTETAVFSTALYELMSSSSELNLPLCVIKQFQ